MPTTPQPTRTTRTKAQQREETTRALVEHARRLFAAKGYAHVSLTEIVQAAGVTKGALYHHFSGKDDVFRAVLEHVHGEVAERIADAAPDADPWTQLVAGCRAFLTASTEPGIQRIMLIDAPSVLGWSDWRDLDAATSMQQLEAALTQLVDDGVIVDQPITPLAHLLSGAMNEAALWLARSPNRDRDLEDTMATLTRLLQSLRG
ncbi:TetR/AcrR family transcriptional regulator [Phytoactinopolyspora halotolerans]|uniref:TetR/AcrR family transcriptional regulator n=1 Tax=Phytoactinopolyspora halotolerans TaxID=1981512 RepID=A0A6L9SEC6_9ACTN|nr:TetR/AcrR family transcriptional regulator [Phytoactinopolyspora halotolerans]NEE03745.1 TetR/AcrR family transcriptional regulator [Phytoactinopolyspora halotolerans]